VQLTIPRAYYFLLLQAVKQTNSALSARCRDETKTKLLEHDQRVAAEEKLGALQVRVASLLKKLQNEEQENSSGKTEIKSMQERLKFLTSQSQELTAAVDAERSNVRLLTDALRDKRDETDKVMVQLSTARSQLVLAGRRDGEPAETFDEDAGPESVTASMSRVTDTRDKERVAENVEPDNDTVRSTGGRGRFYLDAKPSQGYIFIKGERRSAKRFLKQLDLNEVLRKYQRMKPASCIEGLVSKMCHLLGLALVEGEDRLALANQCESQHEHLSTLGRTNDSLLAQLEAEQTARRQIVVGYARAVRAHAIVQSALGTSIAAISRMSSSGSATLTAPGMPALMKHTSVTIKLNECCLGDEELHALVVVMRDSSDAQPSAYEGSAPSYSTPLTGAAVINELQLARNNLTDECTRTLATLLADVTSSVRLVDLRGNHLTVDGVRRLAEALERNSNVQEVVVRGTWRIEATLSPIGLAAVAASSGLTTSSDVVPGSATLASTMAAVHAKISNIIIDAREQTAAPAMNALLHMSEVIPMSSKVLNAAANKAQAGLSTYDSYVDRPTAASPPFTPLGSAPSFTDFNESEFMNMRPSSRGQSPRRTDSPNFEPSLNGSPLADTKTRLPYLSSTKGVDAAKHAVFQSISAPLAASLRRADGSSSARSSSTRPARMQSARRQPRPQTQGSARGNGSRPSTAGMSLPPASPLGDGAHFVSFSDAFAPMDPSPTKPSRFSLD
jgi:hypothetical protein